MVESIRRVKGNNSIERRYYLPVFPWTLTPSPRPFAATGGSKINSIGHLMYLQRRPKAVPALKCRPKPRHIAPYRAQSHQKRPPRKSLSATKKNLSPPSILTFWANYWEFKCVCPGQRGVSCLSSSCCKAFTWRRGCFRILKRLCRNRQHIGRCPERLLSQLYSYSIERRPAFPRPVVSPRSTSS